MWPYKRGGLWWVWHYKRGGLWWVLPYKRGGLWWVWPYKRCGLIRGVAFGGCGLIRGLAFGECGLIRGVLQYSKSPSHIKQNYEKLEIAIVKPVFTEPDLEINFCPQNRHVFGLYRLN